MSEAAPVIAKFVDLKPGMKLKRGDQTLIVELKDNLRVVLSMICESRREVSYYAPEFEAQNFEVIPEPEKKPTRVK